MIKIAVYTLIDITNTGITSNNPDNQFKRNQQRNWETINQVINLRSHATIEASPNTPKQVNLAFHQFGDYYKDHQKCWKFIFSLKYPETIGSIQDPTEKLRYDINGVPIITGLDETVHLPDPVFYIDGLLKNTYFKILTDSE